MSGAEKSGLLSSGLLAAKGAADASDMATPRTVPPRIAKERGPEGAVLFSKGDASASTFRPWYWSYEREETPKTPETPAPRSATVTPISPDITVKAPLEERPRPPTAPRWKRRLVPMAVLAFGCLALGASSMLFVLSLRHSSDPAPTGIAAMPAPPPVIVAPPAMPLSEVAASVLPPVVETPAADPPQFASVPAEVEDTSVLIERGDALRRTGDFAAARLFYERAAEAGSAAAARAVGETFDPLVLGEAQARGVRGDARAAAEWYRKAMTEGDEQAAFRLQRLIAKPPG